MCGGLRTTTWPEPAKPVAHICRANPMSLFYHKCVEKHADHAEANGYVVVGRVDFPDIQYVAHARSYLDKYWALIRDTWEAGQKTVAELQSPVNLLLRPFLISSPQRFSANAIYLSLQHCFEEVSRFRDASEFSCLTSGVRILRLCPKAVLPNQITTSFLIKASVVFTQAEKTT